jgi:hypothetical protein
MDNPPLISRGKTVISTLGLRLAISHPTKMRKGEAMSKYFFEHDSLAHSEPQAL